MTAYAHGFEIHQRLVAMMPLVGDDLFRSLAVRDDRLDLLGGLDQRLDTRGGIPLIGALHGHGHHGARLQIDGVLGLVRQVRASILHLGDLGVGVLRMGPVTLEPLFLRLRSRRAKSSRVGVCIPEACASWVRNS